MSSFGAVTLIVAGLVLAVTGLIRVSIGPHDAQLPAPNRSWTLVGAGTALVALALQLAATGDVAFGGTFCSWPQSATTLSGLGLIVSLIPAFVAIRQTLQHGRRSIAYWVMVGAVVTAVGLYGWLLSGAGHACPGGFVSDLLG